MNGELPVAMPLTSAARVAVRPERNEVTGTNATSAASAVGAGDVLGAEAVGVWAPGEALGDDDPPVAGLAPLVLPFVPTSRPACADGPEAAEDDPSLQPPEAPTAASSTTTVAAATAIALAPGQPARGGCTPLMAAA